MASSSETQAITDSDYGGYVMVWVMIMLAVYGVIGLLAVVHYLG